MRTACRPTEGGIDPVSGRCTEALEMGNRPFRGLATLGSKPSPGPREPRIYRHHGTGNIPGRCSVLCPPGANRRTGSAFSHSLRPIAFRRCGPRTGTRDLSWRQRSHRKPDRGTVANRKTSRLRWEYEIAQRDRGIVFAQSITRLPPFLVVTSQRQLEAQTSNHGSARVLSHDSRRSTQTGKLSRALPPAESRARSCALRSWHVRTVTRPALNSASQPRRSRLLCRFHCPRFAPDTGRL